MAAARRPAGSRTPLFAVGISALFLVVFVLSRRPRVGQTFASGRSAGHVQQHVYPWRGVVSRSATAQAREPMMPGLDLSTSIALGEGLLANATDADATASEGAYRKWAEQFPIAAARRDFYGLPCGRTPVRERFLFLAKMVGIPAPQVLEIFERDLWVLSEPSDKLPPKMAALRDLAGDGGEEEVLEFLRAAPRSLGTTSVEEMRERGIDNMRFRSALGEAYEVVTAPIRMLFFAMAQNTARKIAAEAGDSDETISQQALDKVDSEDRDSRTIAANVFFGSIFALMAWVTYQDYTYGGPVHGKGICPASPIPTYNIPDVEGNTRLPCNCAPLYKWYIEPLLSPEQKERMLGMRPAVASKNCGRELGGAKKECDPTTVGACVWTAADLEKDPSAFDRRELLYWETQRKQ